VLGRHRRQRTFIFELTADCANACVFCYNVRHVCGASEEELSAGRWIALAERLHAETGFEEVALSGGEPLLHPGCEAIAAALDAMGVRVSLVTAGGGLDGERARRLLEAGVGLFQLPLHCADEALHDALAGRRGAYADAARAFAEVFAAGGDAVGVCVVTDANVSRLREAAEAAFALGARGMMVNRVNIGGRALADWRTLLPEPAALEAAFAELDAFCAETDFGASASTVVPPCLVDLSRFRNVSAGFCPGDERDAYYTVGPNGVMRPCNHSRATLGDATEESFGRLRRRPAASRYRRWNAPFCRGCPHEKTCRGGCPAAVEETFGRLDLPDPYVVAYRERAAAWRETVGAPVSADEMKRLERAAVRRADAGRGNF